MNAARLWSEVTSFKNLCRAARHAARGQRRVRGTARFLERLETEALALQRELVAGEWRPARPTTFTIHDPKERVITAAPFRDRVVHHALIDPLEGLFDASLVPETFACRRGKGTHAAIAHARELVRRHRYFLKLDIAKCFDSIEHRVVLDTLAPLELEPEVADLCARVLGGADGKLGVGLPIGNLTSQWFANLLLGRLDRFVLGELGATGYVRYMDDFALFGDDQLALKHAHGAIEAFARDELHLALKTRATILAPVREGLPFLGWNLRRGTQRIRPKNLCRLRRRLRHRAWELRTGRIDASIFAASLRSASTHLAHGDTLDLRRRWLSRGLSRAP
ncbi:MAG: RNA-dependent DNA polymerase [Planctomycetes bacterium]|nr:RNA-dependent DNA polymerase [Planctomycetota bacterium]